MLLKNVTPFVSDGGRSGLSGLTQAGLDTLLRAAECPECGALSKRVYGMAPPSLASDQFVYGINGMLYCMYQQVDRMLPASVVTDEVNRKIAAIRDSEHRVVSRKEKAKIKERITERLLPKALTKSKYVPILIDTQRERILVGSSSASEAERVVGVLRDAIGALAIVPPVTEGVAAPAMASWLRDPGTTPDNTDLGDRGELQASEQGGSKIQYASVYMHANDIIARLDSGMLATRVNLALGDQIEFDLTDRLALKRVKPLDGLVSALESDADAESEDPVGQLSAQLLIESDAYRQALDTLVAYFPQ